MNSTTSELMNCTEMKTINRSPLGNSRAAVDAVRATIEQEFAPLFQKQPRVFLLALNEAEALAWQTPYPHLIFPVLAQEKIRAIADWHERQTFLRRRQGPVLAFAA